MKNVDSIKGMVKRLFVFTMLTVLPLFAAAQQLTVTVESEGQLGAQLPDSIRYSMTDLKICGPLNVNDLKIIQALTSRAKPRNPLNSFSPPSTCLKPRLLRVKVWFAPALTFCQQPCS